MEAQQMILESPAIRRVHRHVVQAATRGARIVLMGPSGSGKEGLAQAYHRSSGRDGAFVARNCAVLSREFLQAELFGAEEGAFTGATRRIVGAVERAHGGTLFLDEIGDLLPEVQPMLLRFLDHGEYERMGNPGQIRRSDARIVCATNKNLRAASRRNEFRPELWYRLSNQVIEVPPLRDRWEDVDAFLKTREVLPGMSARAALSPAALTLVRAHHWEGNFRELESFVARLSSTAPGGIDERACALALREGALGAPVERAAVGGEIPQLAARALEAFAEDLDTPAPRTWGELKDFLECYLKPLLFASMSGVSSLPSRHAGGVRAIAQQLGVDRGTVQKQLKRYLERFGRGA
jgi:DNA-binding NtrC family response regulator